MTIYTIDNPLSDDGRNKINNNFQELKKDINNAVDTISTKAFDQVVDEAKLEWKEPVETSNNLPANASKGDTRMTRDTGKVFRFNGGAWVEIQQIDAGPVNEVDSRLTAQLATNTQQINDIQKEVDNMLCFIPIAISKLKNGVPINVIVIGDSLAQGAGSGNRWVDLVFNSEYSSYGYNLSSKFNGTKINYKNWAVGGSTSHHLMAQIAVEKELVSNIKKINGCINKGEIRALPPLLKNVDVVIISIGANGGKDHESYTEIFVRYLREAGIEVILTTSNPRKSNVSALDFREKYGRLGGLYGLAIADTWSAIRDEYDNGTDPNLIWADDIHMAQIGHNLYAQTITDIFTNEYKEDYNGRFPKSNCFIPTDLPMDKKYTNLPVLQMKPFETNGVMGGTLYRGNPMYPGYLRYSDSDLATMMTTLTIGQEAWFGNDSWYGFDLLFEADGGGTVDVHYIDDRSTPNEKLLKSITVTNLNRVPFVYEGYYDSGFTMKSDAIRVTCTSGSVKLLGVVFHTLGMNGLPHDTTVGFRDVTFSGSWAINNSVIANLPYVYTSELNAYLEFTTYEDGVQFVLGANSGAGTVKVYVDGIEILEKNLLFISGTIGINHSVIIKGLGTGKHKIKLQLTQNNSYELLADLYVFDIKEIPINMPISNMK